MKRPSAQRSWQQTASKTPIVVLSLGLLLSIGLLAALIVHIARQSGMRAIPATRSGTAAGLRKN